jgi:uncharacterized protein (TIGR02271 family)
MDVGLWHGFCTYRRGPGNEQVDDAVRHPGLDGGGSDLMSWSTETNRINVGDDVYGSDGEKVGTVAEVQSGYIVIEKGFFFPTDYYIPTSAVASAGDGQVSLNVAKDAALHSGWDTMPEVVPTGMTDSGTVFIDGDVAVTDRAISGSSVTDLGSTADRLTATAQVADEDEIRILVMEEELTATVRPAEAGAVRIEKRVVEEDRVLEVPVTDEQIRVERRIVDRPVSGSETQAFEEIVIEVPLTREQVELHKQSRVAEEIVVSKEAVQRTEQVRGTVRREEVYVDEDAALSDETERDSSRSQ